VQYFFGQLRLNPATFWRQALAQARPVAAERAPTRQGTEGQPAKQDEADRLSLAYEAVLHEFFDRIDAYVSGRLILVLDADRAALYAGNPVRTWEKPLVVAAGRSHGATVIDTEPIYRAHLDQSSLTLDVGPYDGHLNALGVELVSRAIARALLDSSAPSAQAPH